MTILERISIWPIIYLLPGFIIETVSGIVAGGAIVSTITKGQYVGQEAEADHVIPRAICPELQNQVMNLELLPASLNRAKSDKVTERGSLFAKELYDAKLLSEQGYRATYGRE